MDEIKLDLEEKLEEKNESTKPETGELEFGMPQKPKKKPKMYLWLFVGAVVVLLAAGYFFMDTYMDGERADESMQVIVDQFWQLPAATPKPTVEPGATAEVTARPVQETVDPSWRYQTPKPVNIDDVIGILEVRGSQMAVLKERTAENLKASVCQLAGPELNEPGNVLLEGHNYASGAQFGALKKLKVGDKVKLTDKQKRTMTYRVYDTMVIEYNETEKTDTDLYQSLVLITCTQQGTKRLAVMCELVS